MAYASIWQKNLAIKTPKRTILTSKWSFERGLILTLLLSLIFSSAAADYFPPKKTDPFSTKKTDVPPKKQGKLVIPPSEKTVSPQTPTELFYYPGVVSYRDGKWVGGDNFINLSKNMAIQVDMTQPENLTLNISKATLTERVLSKFEAAGIQRSLQGVDGKPPLPFFHILILIYPINNGFAAACIGRLFEDVQVDRVHLVKGEVLQAITWEQANLIVTPEEEFEKNLINTIEVISSNFIKRRAAYQAPSQEK